MRRAALGLAWIAALLSGCVAAPPQLAVPGAAPCAELLARVDDAVSQAGVGDAMSTRVPGRRHLRTDRFLASFARDSLDDAQFAEWLRRLAALGAQAYRIEIANLPDTEDRASLQARVEACSASLAAADEADRAGRAALREAVVVPDDYSTAQRVVGLYWLTRIPFSNGVRRWQEEVRESFDRPIVMTGQARRYEPPREPGAPGQLAAILERAAANALRIPTPVGADAETLFRAYAPTFVVDTASAADIPGGLMLDGSGRVRVAEGAAVVYRRFSHARHEGRVLLQLNYWLWFPERPRRGAWDLLGGTLDGLLWRVTLSPQGIPLAFDSIHPCGCYHLFFPTPRAIPRPQPETLDEAGYFPAALRAVVPGESVELWLEPSTHYLRRVAVGGEPAQGTPYAFAEDDALRSLPLPAGGRRSAFRPDGIVAGTERGERWLFWPMGIAEPGAMRQWGRHATAFVGRRHFDDPGLLSRYFDLVIIP